MHHRQAEAGALADALGREERLDRARQRRLVHADAGVGDRQADIVAGRQLRAMPGADRLALGARCVSVPPSGMASRAFTAEVEERHLELVGVGLRRRQVVGDLDARP